MKIAMAADHAGFALKEKLRRRLAQEGHEVLDFGATSAEVAPKSSTSWPSWASLRRSFSFSANPAWSAAMAIFIKGKTLILPC